MPIRSWMSSIMGQIEPEHLELYALEFGKLTNQHQTCVYEHKISDAFGYGSMHIRLVSVICP